MLGDLVGGQRLLDVGFHQQHGLGQLRVAGAEAILQRNALTLTALTNALDHQLLAHRTGQLGAVIARQHRQQQIEHGQTTAGGQAITIPIEQMAGGDDLGETLGEIVLPAPVHCRAITIEQTELSQRIDPGRQPADHTTAAYLLLERRRQPRRHLRWRRIGEQEQLVQPFQMPGPGLARQTPVTRSQRLGLEEHQLVHHFRMHALGDTQGLLRQGQGQGLGAGPVQKADSMGSH